MSINVASGYISGYNKYCGRGRTKINKICKFLSPELYYWKLKRFSICRGVSHKSFSYIQIISGCSQKNPIH